MIVNTNTAAMSALNSYTKNYKTLSSSLEKISSGSRINSAADDASGLMISEKMRAQIASYEQAYKNGEDAISFIETAEGALQNTTNALQKMRELVVQAQNTGALTEEDRESISLELDALRDEINRISSSTAFNGNKLIDGSYTAGSEASFKVGVSSSANDSITVQIDDMSAKGLSKDKTDNFSIDISTDEAMVQTLENIDYALDTVLKQRSVLGATENRIEYALENIEKTTLNLTNAESRIRDVDVAEEITKYQNQALKVQASMMMMAQANQQPSMVLTLLQGI
ncbi:MAG: flagellin [Clostridiales bacterium]|nr:flagellin [Clostridiales bacterium]